MKIVNKLSLFVFFLLSILVANTLTGLFQLGLIGRELKNVTETDVELIQVASQIRQRQLEKMILFERFSRIVEELSFEELSPARRQHLLDHAGLIHRGLNDLAQAGGQQILKGQQLLFEMKPSLSARDTSLARQVKEIVDQIEQAHIQYDRIIERMFAPLQGGDVELSIGMLHRVQAQERALSKKLERLIILIETLIHDSFYRAVYQEKKAEWILWLSVLMTAILSLLVVVLLMKGITSPLNALGIAARQIGEGRLSIHLNEHKRDEFGEVSGAFNQMSRRLVEAKQALEKTNQELADNLLVTQNQKLDLEKVNRELDHFAHTVSHDLRSPLMGIMGYGSILESQYLVNLDERGQKCVRRIRQGVERLNRMIDDLLALTRLSRIKNPYEPVDLQLVFQEVLERLEFRIKEHQVEIVMSRALPTVICDRIKITEAFLNLMSNAVKFSSKRPDGKPRIEIGYEKVNDAHQFWIRDNGVGIAKEDQSKVFEIFQRVGRTEEFEGTGAGLSIVKKVVDDHGGKIWIESQEGAGATFYFVIPSQILTASCV